MIAVLVMSKSVLKEYIADSMALEPQKFRLALERPSQPGDLKPGSEVVCIVTALDSFTPQVRLQS